MVKMVSFSLHIFFHNKKNPKKNYFQPKFFSYAHGSANSENLSYNCTL